MESGLIRSNQPGGMGVYRCPASGGTAVLLSKNVDGFSPQESFDGKTVYFASHEGNLTQENGPVGAARYGIRSGWIASPARLQPLDPLTRRIYFVPAEAPRSVRYFDLASKQTRQIFEADKNFARGLSVSPDGRWILYSQEDVNSDIMLVDHFR